MSPIVTTGNLMPRTSAKADPMLHNIDRALLEQPADAVREYEEVIDLHRTYGGD